MIQRRISRILIALLLTSTLSILLPPRSQACGPFFTDAVFVFTKHPDFPLEHFAAGKVGVVTPTWARSYLVAAYRNLANTPLSDAEAKGIKALWDERLSLGWEYHDDDWIKK